MFPECPNDLSTCRLQQCRYRVSKDAPRPNLTLGSEQPVDCNTLPCGVWCLFMELSRSFACRVPSCLTIALFARQIERRMTPTSNGYHDHAHSSVHPPLQCYYTVFPLLRAIVHIRLRFPPPASRFMAVAALHMHLVHWSPFRFGSPRPLASIGGAGRPFSCLVVLYSSLMSAHTTVPIDTFWTTTGMPGFRARAGALGFNGPQTPTDLSRTATLARYSCSTVQHGQLH